MSDAILQAYHLAKRHLMPELPDDMPVVLLVKFRLGDLRELDAIRNGDRASGGNV